MPKKVLIPNKQLKKFPSPVDVEYSLEFLRVDNRQVGSRIIDCVAGADQPLCEDTRHVSCSLDDLPQEAQDAYEVLMDAIFDRACDCPQCSNDDLLEVNDPERFAEKEAEKLAKAEAEAEKK
jgi:hypothetical protein